MVAHPALLAQVFNCLGYNQPNESTEQQLVFLCELSNASYLTMTSEHHFSLVSSCRGVYFALWYLAYIHIYGWIYI